MLYSALDFINERYCGHAHKTPRAAVECRFVRGGGYDILAYRTPDDPSHDIDGRVRTIFEYRGGERDHYCADCEDHQWLGGIGDRRIRCPCVAQIDALVPRRGRKPKEVTDA